MARVRKVLTFQERLAVYDWMRNNKDIALSKSREELADFLTETFGFTVTDSQVLGVETDLGWKRRARSSIRNTTTAELSALLKRLAARTMDAGNYASFATEVDAVLGVVNE